MADEESGAFELGTDGPKVILVGIDDSVTSLRAGAYAAGLARRQGARLVCVFVEPISGFYGASAAGAGVLAARDEVLAETAADLRRRVEEGAGALGVPVTFIATRGDPYNALVKTAEELRADAVVIGVSEQAGHRFLGSVAVRLVKAGRWPVTVVP